MEKEIETRKMERREMKKKAYREPKIESIHSIREVTKGATIGTTDVNGGSNPPYDPQ